MKYIQHLKNTVDTGSPFCSQTSIIDKFRTHLCTIQNKTRLAIAEFLNLHSITQV